MIKAAIYGASGYTGLELIRLLLSHPQVEVSALLSESRAGESVEKVFPHLEKLLSLTFESPQDSKKLKSCDVVFAALPHGVSAGKLYPLVEEGIRVIDLSGDFRLKDQEIYEKWYKVAHPAPQFLEKAVYGLPELWRKKIAGASLVANPGCYPTSVILPLAPLLREGLIEGKGVVADCKSGVSGAGKKVAEGFIFTEIDEDFKGYSPVGHRHVPEMEQELSALSSSPVHITFSPHLLPVKRGMLSTLYVDLAEGVEGKELEECLLRVYEEEPFVRVRREGPPPRIRDVVGTNFCDVRCYVDEDARKGVVFSVIDNLAKGASSQAVQNMNIMFNLPETAGLHLGALLP